MQAITWLGTYHLQGKDQQNTSKPSIKQRKGSTIHKEVACSHYIGLGCWVSLSGEYHPEEKGKCPINQRQAGFKRAFEVSWGRHLIYLINKRVRLKLFYKPANYIRCLKIPPCHSIHLQTLKEYMHIPLICVKRSF